MIRKAIFEQKERGDRAGNVKIFNTSGSGKDIIEERVERDKGMVRRLSYAMGILDNIEIEKCVRIGKKEPTSFIKGYTQR